MAKKKVTKVVSVDENTGVFILQSTHKAGKKLTLSVNGKTVSGVVEPGGQCWIRSGKPLGRSYTFKLV